MPNVTIAERIERRILSVASGITGVTRATRWGIPTASDGTEEYRAGQVIVFPQSDTPRNNASGVVGCVESEKTVTVAVVLGTNEAAGGVEIAKQRTSWIGLLRTTFLALSGRLTETGGTILTVDMLCEEDNTGEIADGVSVAAILLRCIYRTSLTDPTSYDTLITASA